MVDFVFCGRNCKIKFKTKSLKSKFYTVSSETEFLILVYRLDHRITTSTDFTTNENNRQNYGIFEEEANLNEIFSHCCSIYF